MKKLTVFTFLFLLVVLTSACGKDKTTNTIALAGDKVFQDSCISCHSSGGISGGQVMLDASKIHNDFTSSKDLSAFVRKNMPKSSPGSLSSEEYDAVVKYLWAQK